MSTNIQRREILSGWKEVASYIGRGVRTVQRYERDLGLPVRRPARKSTGSVIATKAEINGWITSSPIREAFRLPRLTVENASPLKEFHRHIEELHQLRQEAAQLRGEIRVSLERPRASIQVLSENSLCRSSPQRPSPAAVQPFDPTMKQAN